jgi:hypothetical protein
MGWLANYVAGLVTTSISVGTMAIVWRIADGNWPNPGQLALSVALLALWNTFRWESRA